MKENLIELRESGDLLLYPKFKESTELHQLMADSNNIIEFKYE